MGSLNPEPYLSAALARGARLLPDVADRLHSHFCGCGEPELAWEWVLAYLRARSTAQQFPIEDGATCIAAYLLDHLRYTEHGGAIYSAWLTQDGKALLAFLEEFGSGWDDLGEWVNSQGVSMGNFDA